MERELREIDLLQKCARGFERLTDWQYHFIVGRKGKTIAFTVSFDRSDFHHLAGLHKLKDNARIQTGQREAVMLDILNGKLTLEQIQKSAFYGEMEPRLYPLSALEQILDSNDMVFRYNAKVRAFSLIQADYLLQNDFEGNPVYLFLAKRSNDDTQVCRTIFPKSSVDYAEGQPRYTLLRKEKINLQTGTRIVQYDRLTPKHLLDREAPDMREEYDRSGGRPNPYIGRIK